MVGGTPASSGGRPASGGSVEAKYSSLGWLEAELRRREMAPRIPRSLGQSLAEEMRRTELAADENALRPPGPRYVPVAE